jgi:GMP synthase-like glutamine amidotransferase
VQKSIRIAVLDLYEGETNEGMRCIRQLLDHFKAESGHEVSYEIFDVRKSLQTPAASDFDGYISSGGPGSPLTSVGSRWEKLYFGLMNDIQQHNRENENKKFVFLICHSFQIFCRYYGLAKVSKRKSTAFGVMPIHKTRHAKGEKLLENLDEPFWAVDSRDYQITTPNTDKIHQMGGHVLCIEKDRPLIPLERATMAIRFNDEIIGTQFHPEADSDGMYMYLLRDDKKSYVIKKYGESKYTDMLEALNDPEKIKTTYSSIIPTFLKQIERHHDRLGQKSLQPQF